MNIFKVEAQGDVVYIQAEAQSEAEKKLFAFTGPIPLSLLVWNIVEEIPDGEELL